MWICMTSMDLPRRRIDKNSCHIERVDRTVDHVKAPWRYCGNRPAEKENKKKHTHTHTQNNNKQTNKKNCHMQTVSRIVGVKAPSPYCDNWPAFGGPGRGHNSTGLGPGWGRPVDLLEAATWGGYGDRLSFCATSLPRNCTWSGMASGKALLPRLIFDI